MSSSQIEETREYFTCAYINVFQTLKSFFNPTEVDCLGSDSLGVSGFLHPEFP